MNVSSPHRPLFVVMALGLALAAATVVLAVPPAALSVPPAASVWLTDLGTSARLQPQVQVPLTPGTSPVPFTINVDPQTRYQSIVGFGASLTDSSAWLINQLSSTQRDGVMRALFSPTDGIGVSMLRQPMGASDFTASGVYSYDDVPAGQTDPGLGHFSISHDLTYIVPELRQALAIAPDLTVMATPWSPPGWMRRGDSMLGPVGLDLLPQYYSAWAQYFVKFLQAYQTAGVAVKYITPQNEPTNLAVSYPGMQVGEPDMANLVTNYLGPALTSAGLTTKILGWDFTWDNTAYPTGLLSDPGASPYISGTAWHCYAGDPQAMANLQQAFPTKDNFETECSGLISNGASEPVRTDATQFSDTVNLLINSTRDSARSVILWNLALDDSHGPSIGCQTCRPLVTIHGSSLLGYTGWSPAIEYYAVGQVAKFVRPGAVRVASNTMPGGINDTAFVNTDGSGVVVAVNNGSTAQTFGVQWKNDWFSYSLNPGAVATFKLP